jgi:hypothetical protein
VDRAAPVIHHTMRAARAKPQVSAPDESSAPTRSCRSLRRTARRHVLARARSMRAALRHPTNARRSASARADDFTRAADVNRLSVAQVPVFAVVGGFALPWLPPLAPTALFLVELA